MRRRGTAVAGVVLALLLAGCGGDGAGAEAGPSGSTSSTTGGATTEPSGTPEVAPATGPEMRLGNVSLRVPEGHEPRQVNDLIMSSTGPQGDRVTLSASSVIAAKSLDELAESEAELGMWQQKPRRLDDVTVGGVEMFHLRGKGFAGYPSDVFGTQEGGKDVSISILSFRPERERTGIVEAVLASVTWS